MKNNMEIIMDVMTMSSREIAELTNKEHRNVLADCDKLNENYRKMGLAEISAGVYTHPNTGTQQHREMLLTKIQTLDLMTGYNIELRIKINRRWEELEKEKAQIKPVSSIDLFELALKSIKENQAEVQELKKEVSHVKDDFKVLEQKVASPKYFTIEQYCKLHSIIINDAQEAALGKRATKLSKQMGYPIGTIRHKHWGLINTYSETVLDTLRKLEIEDTLFD